MLHDRTTEADSTRRPAFQALALLCLPFRALSSTFEEVGSAPLGHFVRRVHIGHELGEGTGNGAGPDPRHHVHLTTPENPVGQQTRHQGQG